MKNWMVIANAARARVLVEESGKPHVYAHIADLVHPQSRQKGEELAYDRPGYAEGSAPGTAGAVYPPRTNPRERERDRFAQEVARLLDQGIADGRCAGLVLVASSPFLGHLKAHLGVQARKAIVRTVDADYTALRDSDLAERLAEPEGSV
jgi:protein required for attachment to host cells